MTGFHVDLDVGDAGAILATIVLFLHEDVHLIHGVHRSILLNVIRKWFSQADHRNTAFMKYFVTHGLFVVARPPR